jgi:hypothetical protein
MRKTGKFRFPIKREGNTDEMQYDSCNPAKAAIEFTP